MRVRPAEPAPRRGAAAGPAGSTGGGGAAGTTDASAGTGGSVPVPGGCSQAPTPAAGATVI